MLHATTPLFRLIYSGQMEIRVAKEILNLKPGDPVDVRKFRDQIHGEFDNAGSSEERGELLGVFKTLMDLAERNLQSSGVPDSVLDEFRKIREQDYCLFLAKESTIDGNACSEILDEVTRREMQAGRMSQDHALRELAVIGTTFGIGSREQLEAISNQKIPDPWWQRAANWLRRR